VSDAGDGVCAFGDAPMTALRPSPDAAGSVAGPIAYLTGEYPKASHTFILREIEALRAAGTTVLTCSIRRSGPEHLIGPEEVAAAASTFHVLDAAMNPGRLVAAHAALMGRAPRRYLQTLGLAWRARRHGIKGLIFQLAYLLEAGVLAVRLQRDGVRHIHNHFVGSSCTVAMLTASLLGISFSFTLHGPADLLAPREWRLDLKVARAAFVACISHFARSQTMLHTDRRDWDKLFIVHCGVEPDRYAPTVTTGNRLLFVGRLAAVKGLPVLLQAVELLRETAPELELTLIGDGPDRTALEAMAAPLGTMVRFAGYRSQDEVAKALASTDIFVLPSFAEGVPVVLMEAMASARPVVATRIAGIPELVEDGTHGLLVSPGDPEGLAQALGKLLGDPITRARMGEAGQARVRDAFDIRTEALRMRTLLSQALSDGPSS
jgi:glycosyltransferase involved in cell wall biosynthesis